jgi:hypothetical protein
VGTEQQLARLFQFLEVDRDSEFGETHALELLACFFNAHPRAWEALRRYLAGEGELDPITAARTPGDLRAALLPLLPPGRWDVRCNSWGLVAYPAQQTRSAQS